MTRLNAAMFFAVLAVAAFPSAVRAEEKDPPEPQEEKEMWKTRVDVTTRYHFFGYVPSKILALEGETPFASTVPSVRMDVRARLTIVGKYLHLDLQPYTAVPEDIVRVNIGGLEGTVLAPVTESFRIGFYHHSSHNFSDATYGWGIDLNAVVIDADLFDGKFSLMGEEAFYRFRSLSHWYWKGSAPPYLVTRHTEVVPGTIEPTQWRSSLEFQADHPRGRSDCNLTFLSPEWLPTSVSATCAGTFKLGNTFFGAAGDHLFVGPFLSFGQNFRRVSEFGRYTVYGGLRMDLVFIDELTPVP